MPGFELINHKEKKAVNEVFKNGSVFFRHGFDNLDSLKDMVKERLSEEFEQASKSRLKRSLLDTLADQYTFSVLSSSQYKPSYRAYRVV